MTQESPDQSSVSSSCNVVDLQTDKMSIITGDAFYQSLLESLKAKLESGCGETLHEIGNAGGKIIIDQITCMTNMSFNLQMQCHP